jgi:FkbM family methyltransferase
MHDRSSILATAFRMLCDVECKVTAAALAMGIKRSRFSQKRQDAWLIERALPGKHGGYFVELGAGDGVTHSNTIALEKYYGWNGLLIEANPDYCQKIRQRRNTACVEACIDGQERHADFLPFGYLGGIVGEDTDNSMAVRKTLLTRHAASMMKLKTRTLASILDQANAPELIDFMSIDIEGAELRVLSTFPFRQYRFGAITVERPNQELHELLSDSGYILDRVFLYDGFYVSEEIANRLGIRRSTFVEVAKRTY